MVQFDGSAHRTRGVGGAGAALLQVECSGPALLDWGAQALPVCADNIVAEAHGAELAISLLRNIVNYVNSNPSLHSP